MSNKNTKNNKKANKNKKPKKFIGKIVLICLFVIAIGVGWVSAKVEIQINSILNNVNRDLNETLSDVDVGAYNLISDENIVNILLIGSDKRADWNDVGRSDCTMILTIDFKNNKLKLTSLMRDMYVQIPNIGQDKFNSAYSYGGVSLLYETIASCFGVKLDGYIIVDFEAFKSVINALGGVEVELTQAEYEYLTTAYKKGSVLELKQGLNNMNGSQALAYARIRQDAQGDFGRTKRQRVIIQSILQKIKGMSLTSIIDIAGNVMSYVTTDLSNDQMITYIKSILKMGTTTVDELRIPIDNSYTNERIDGKAVLVVDFDTNKDAIYNFIYN